MNKENESIISLINDYRECARSIWNNYFSEKFTSLQDWGLVDSFKIVREELFRSIVLAAAFDDDIPNFSLGFPCNVIRVALKGDENWTTSVMINRTKGETHGYWDHPLTKIRPNTDLLFVDLFDWDTYGFLDMSLVVAEVLTCPDAPEIVGHRLIVELRYIDIVTKTGP
jgi:hypothetical protein